MPRGQYDTDAAAEDLDLENPDEPGDEQQEDLGPDAGDTPDQQGGQGEPSAKTAEIPSWAKELGSQVNVLGSLVHQLYGKSTEQEHQRQIYPPARQERQEEPDPMERLQRLEQEALYNRQLRANVHEQSKHTQVERFRQAERELKERYGEDFDKLVPVESRENLVRSFLSDADRMPPEALELKYGFQRMGWGPQLETMFKKLDYDRLKQREKDEVAKKREQRERDSKAASRIPSGGAVYQGEKPYKADPLKRGYSDAAKAAKQYWDSQLGG